MQIEYGTTESGGGDTLATILVVLLVLGLLGAGGWIAYNEIEKSRKKKDVLPTGNTASKGVYSFRFDKSNKTFETDFDGDFRESGSWNNWNKTFGMGSGNYRYDIKEHPNGQIEFTMEQNLKKPFDVKVFVDGMEIAPTTKTHSNSKVTTAIF